MNLKNTNSNLTVFKEGIRDGFPIGLGYFAVAFSLGILARTAHFTPLQGFINSFLNRASAGEYAVYTVVAAGAGFVEMAIMTLVVNARYLLMSTALSQKFDPETSLIHRMLVGFSVTDEIFAITINRPGFINPIYNYGACAIAVPCWALGTSCGIVAGSKSCQCIFCCFVWNVFSLHYAGSQKTQNSGSVNYSKLCSQLFSI